MAQSAEHPTLDFGSGHDLRVMGSSPTWDHDNRTITQITELDGEMRIHEVARMISGVEVTPLTLDHAAELIAQNTK